MSAYKRSIPCLDGAIIKMPVDGYIEIGNRSSSTLTVSLSFFIDDSTRAKTEAETTGILEATTKYDSSATTEIYYTVEAISGNTSKGITRQLPSGTKVKVEGGAFTALIWG